MKVLVAIVLTFYSLTPHLAKAQEEKQADNSSKNLIVQKLFEEEEVLEIVLKGDTRNLLKDRFDEAEYFPMKLVYTNADSEEVIHKLKVKTRGNFRRKRSNCFYPPLLLNFPKSNIPSGSVFSGQDKLKLVTACKGEKYVIREYLTYKLYNLVTDYSFKARLVRVVLEDTVRGKKSDSFYSIIIEDEDAMARRNGKEIKKIDQVKPRETDWGFFHKMAVFQYMIGNTDWSTQFRQNIKLLYGMGIDKPITVPYDFDHAGIVGAPYALPPAELLLSSTKERRYRGFCLEGEEEVLNKTLDYFKELKPAIYKVYEDCPLLTTKYQKSTRKYLDNFYKTLDSKAKRKEAFGYPCLNNGTGNVIIKGLRN